MSKPGETRLADRFARGDVLVLRADSNSPAWGSATEPFVPRECCVVEAGEEWLTIGVGISWPRCQIIWSNLQRALQFRKRLVETRRAERS